MGRQQKQASVPRLSGASEWMARPDTVAAAIAVTIDKIDNGFRHQLGSCEAVDRTCQNAMVDMRGGEFGILKQLHAVAAGYR